MSEIYYPEGFFETTLSADLTTSATTVSLTAVPSRVTKGYMIIEPSSPTKREVVHFTSVGSSSVTTADDTTDSGDATGRGCIGSIVVGANTAHDQGVTVIIAASEKYWKRVYDAVCTVVNQADGTIKKATGATVNTGTADDTIVTPKAIADSTIGKAPASATENVTGTDNVKFLTSLANVPAFNDSLFRQAIINGNFDVWQRGVSITTINTYNADRWRYWDNGSSRTITKDTDVPNVDSLSSWKTVIATGGTNRYFILQQRFEGSTSGRFSGKSVTLSFYVKASVAAGTLSNGSIVFEYASALDNFSTTDAATSTTFTATGSWTKVTKTFTLPAVSPISSYSIANGMSFYISLGATDDTTLTVNIDQVQLCAGDVAIPFMPKSFEEELRSCQRYYQQFGGTAYFPLASGKCDSTTVAQLFKPLLVKMRTNSVVTAYSGTFQVAKADGTLSDATLADNQVSDSGILIAATTTNIVAGNATHLFTKNSTTSYIAVSAEL